MILGKKDKERIKKIESSYEDLCKAIDTTARKAIEILGPESGKSQARKVENTIQFLKSFHDLSHLGRKQIEDVKFNLK